MKVDFKRELKGARQEVVDIHLEWNPQMPDEEGYVALVVSIVDLIQSHDRLNRLVDYAPGEQQ
jgi:hypothetical protein